MSDFTGHIVLRQFEPGAGLAESTTTFRSLAELFQACLRLDQPQLVDRIVISGADTAGQARTLTFMFQLLTVTPPAN
ncbi:MAG: hypothetical protein IT317_03560 [Anaerolineales bacterium]|nr:hypothetical protein [Anaerolineales bacterium]